MNRAQFQKWLKTISTFEIDPNAVQVGPLHPTEPPETAEHRTTMVKERLLDRFIQAKSGDRRGAGLNAGGNNIPFDFGFRDGKSEDNFTAEFSIYSSRASISLYNFMVKRVFLQDSRAVFLKNLDIETLEVNIDSNCNLELEDCLIGNLIISKDSVHNLSVKSGMICNIISPSPTKDNPFNGSVFFDHKVTFPEHSGFLLKGPQAYKNMRAHMIKLENFAMASHFHRLEQLVERETLTWFDKIISVIYSALSKFGFSSLRPLIWLEALLLFTICLIFFFDAATPSNPDELIGWQRALLQSDMLAQAKRAVELTAQATFNPLGVFGSKMMLVPKHGWLAVWLFFHSLFSTTLGALFFLAIRRRFRMI